MSSSTIVSHTVYNTIADNNLIPSLMNKFQSNETLQVDLLNATGGAVAPNVPNMTKCEHKINKYERFS